MDLILDSIEAVGDKGGDRQAVIDQVLKNTKGRESVLGTYDIDENGDTTLTDYGLYRIEARQARVRQGHQGRQRVDRPRTIRGAWRMPRPPVYV